LLQLSGIGDQKLLKSFGIKVVQHLPGVGQNMQEHSIFPVIFQTKGNFQVEKGCTLGLTPDDPCLKIYEKTRSNYYSTDGALMGLLLSTTPRLAYPPEKVPDTLMLFAPFKFVGWKISNWFQLVVGSVPEYVSAVFFKAYSPNNSSWVKITSTNPFNVPNIQFNNDADTSTERKRRVQLIRFIRNLVNNKNLPFAQYVAAEALPGPSYTTEEQLESYVEGYPTGVHVCCTAKMGSTTDPMAVVDSKGRVMHMQNLRVVDVSIFPKVPGYYPLLPLYILAQKLADVIAKDYQTG